MAQVANTFETYDAVGNREELADTIYQTTPEETPFLSMIRRKSINSIHPEWQTDELAAPDTDNSRAEGNAYVYDALTPSVRVGNYAQISTKTFLVSGTQEEVNKAGRKSEVAYGLARKGVELRTDIEAIYLSNQASSAGTGDGATNRKSGGFRAWLATNDSLGANGASGGFSNGVVTAATNGDQRAFTKALLDTVILNTYNSGGDPTTLMVSPYVKSVFDTFMADADVAPFRIPIKASSKKTIVATADAYMGLAGEIMVVPNRQMARAGASIARNAFLIDPKMVAHGVLRDIRVEKPAKDGDYEKRVLLTEYSLLVMNEKAHGVVADLYGLTSGS